MHELVMKQHISNEYNHNTKKTSTGNHVIPIFLIIFLSVYKFHCLIHTEIYTTNRITAKL